MHGAEHGCDDAIRDDGTFARWFLVVVVLVAGMFLAGAVAATVIPVGAAVLMTGAANAATGAHPAPAAASVTAHVSNSTPVSGKTFRVSGEFTENNEPAADQVVKIQAMQDGSSQQLTGAKVRTDSQGDYSLLVILDTTGHRELRVVGVGVGSQPNAYQPFGVQVHG